MPPAATPSTPSRADVASSSTTVRALPRSFGFGDKGEVIDGFGTAMFLNHSCDPNCRTEEHKGRVLIRAIRDIAANEELVYEYNLYDSDDDTANCYCNAPQCRGTMFSDEELKRQERKKARKKARAAKN
jgi:hypothetical protein